MILDTLDDLADRPYHLERLAPGITLEQGVATRDRCVEALKRNVLAFNGDVLTDDDIETGLKVTTAGEFAYAVHRG